MDLVLFFTGIAIFFIGFFAGRGFTKVEGLFIIDDSDEETQRWTLDAKIPPEEISKRKKITFKVKKV